MTDAEIEAWCETQGVAGYVGTSALGGEGLDALLAKLDEVLDWGAMPETVTTATFKRVKDRALALKAADEQLLVSPAELRGLLAADDPTWRFTDAEMMTAVGHLASHGYVGLLDGGSHILLAPEVLANVASSLVLEARRHPQGLGALDERELLRGAVRLPEVEELPDEARRLLVEAAIALFIEHHLCFRESVGRDTLLVFPALINERRPSGDHDATRDAVTYRVRGRVENVYASLVVRLGYTRHFIGTHHWRDQAQYRARYQMDDTGACGFRQIAERAGEIELVVEYGVGFTARRFFEGLIEAFLRSREVAVTRFPREDCPACGYAIERATFIRRIDEGKGFVFCPECGEKQAVPKQGEVITLAPAERARVVEAQQQTRRRTDYEQALVAVKAKLAPDAGRPTAFLSYAWGAAAHAEWMRELDRDLRNADVEVLFDQRDNAALGRDVARFVERLDAVQWVIVVGTPGYLAKHSTAERTKVVAAEMDLVHQRLVGAQARPDSVIPLLVEGEAATALPPLLRGLTYGDMRDDAGYFATLFDVVLTLHGVPQTDPEINRWREVLRRSAHGFGLR